MHMIKLFKSFLHDEQLMSSVINYIERIIYIIIVE